MILTYCVSIYNHWHDGKMDWHSCKTKCGHGLDNTQHNDTKYSSTQDNGLH